MTFSLAEGLRMTGPGLDMLLTRGSRFVALYASFLQPPIIVFASEASSPLLTIQLEYSSSYSSSPLLHATPQVARSAAPITLSLPSMHPKATPARSLAGGATYGLVVWKSMAVMQGPYVGSHKLSTCRPPVYH